MTKFWTPGTVKTRLGRSIGATAAAEVHRRLLRFLLITLTPVPCRKTVVYTPTDAEADFRRWLIDEGLDGDWSLTPQSDGDLGQRMANRLAATLPDDDAISLLIGADCPDIDPPRIGRAAAALADHDIVIGPAADGGYYLIGIRGRWNQALAGLFEPMRWGGGDVAERTRTRARAAGLSITNLDVESDIDTGEDLRHFVARSDKSDSFDDLRDDLRRWINDQAS